MLIVLISLELETKSGDHIWHILNLKFDIEKFLLIDSNFLDVLRTQSRSQIAIMHYR